MADLTLDMTSPQFISELNTKINEAAASGGGGGGGSTSSIGRTVQLQMQYGKMVNGYVSRNTDPSSDADFKNYCHSVLMMGIENCAITNIATQIGETPTIFCYGKDVNGSTYVQADDYITSVNSVSAIPSDTCYVKIMLSKSSAFETLRQLEVTVNGRPTLIKNKTADTNTPHYFSFEASYPSAAEVGNPATSADLSNDDKVYIGTASNNSASMNCYDNGFIVLPPNYSTTNTQVPLILYCHGEGEFAWNTTFANDSKQKRIFSFLANNGYAVCDCTGMTSNHRDLGNAFFMPSYASSIACLLKYIYANYNVKTDGIYVCGKSSGGFMSLLLPQLNGFKIKAAAGLSAITSPLMVMTFGNTYSTYSNNTLAAILWKQLRVTEQMYNKDIDGSASSDTLSNGTGINDHQDHTYTAYKNADKLRRYDAFFKSTDLSDDDIKAFIKYYYNSGCTNPDNLYANAGSNQTIRDILNDTKIITRCPVKLWQSDGDSTIDKSYAEWFVKWCKNGGSPAYLRRLPAGTSGSGNVSSHNLVDELGTNDLKVSYTPKYGSSVNETIAVCEMVDWFNQW